MKKIMCLDCEMVFWGDSLKNDCCPYCGKKNFKVEDVKPTLVIIDEVNRDDLSIKKLKDYLDKRN